MRVDREILVGWKIRNDMDFGRNWSPELPFVLVGQFREFWCFTCSIDRQSKCHDKIVVVPRLCFHLDILGLLVSPVLEVLEFFNKFVDLGVIDIRDLSYRRIVFHRFLKHLDEMELGFFGEDVSVGSIEFKFFIDRVSDTSRIDDDICAVKTLFERDNLIDDY